MNKLEQMGCLERIRNIYSSLNSAERKAAQFILENPKKIIHFSITELSNSSHVSDATVFRLCQKLGYKGYQDLKINLAGAVIEPFQNINEDISEDDEMYIIMQKLLHLDIDNLENTVKVNKSEEIEKAVQFITCADQLLFFGMAGSGALAVDACNKFIRTGLRCSVQTDSHWQAIYASLLKKTMLYLLFPIQAVTKN